MFKNILTTYKYILMTVVMLFSLSASIVGAGNDFNMHGYMWSPQVGWISMNCADLGVCGIINFGVSQDEEGYWQGTAWSPSLGWIDFGTQIGRASARVMSNRMTGWGRIRSFDYSNPCATCWNNKYGWLSMSSENGGGVGYGVSTRSNSARTEFSYFGYAWGGGMVLGYVDFSKVSMLKLVTDDLTLIANPTTVLVTSPQTTLTYSTIKENYKTCEATSTPSSISWSGSVTPLNVTNGRTIAKTNVLVVPDVNNSADYKIRCLKQNNSWTSWVSARVNVSVGQACFVGDPGCGTPLDSGGYCLASNAETYTISWKSNGVNYVSCKASSTPNISSWNSLTYITPPTANSGIHTKDIGLTLGQLPVTLTLVCKDSNGEDTRLVRTISSVCNSTLNLTSSSECVSPTQKNVTLTWSNGQNQTQFDYCAASSIPAQASWIGEKTAPGTLGANFFSQSNISVSAPKTDYTLTCKKGRDSVSAMTTVNLCNPLTASLYALPSKLATPGVTALSWNNTGAEYCKITSQPENVYENSNQNSVIGANSVGSIAVNQTTWFRIYCTQGARSVSSEAKVCVGDDVNCGKTVCEAFPNLPYCKKKVPIFEEH